MAAFDAFLVKVEIRTMMIRTAEEERTIERASKGV